MNSGFHRNETRDKPNSNACFFNSVEFSLNVFTEFAEFSDKNTNILKRRARTHYLLCERQGFYQWSTEIQLTEQILILNLIHASVISQIP